MQIGNKLVNIFLFALKRVYTDDIQKNQWKPGIKTDIKK